AVPIFSDRARQLGERLVELACRGDERVVAERRDLRRNPLSFLARVKDPFDLIVQSEERELARDDLLRERLPAPLVLELHQLIRSEEHTSELQSRGHLVCRLLLEQKNYSRNQFFIRLIISNYV